MCVECFVIAQSSWGEVWPRAAFIHQQHNCVVRCGEKCTLTSVRPDDCAKPPHQTETDRWTYWAQKWCLCSLRLLNFLVFQENRVLLWLSVVQCLVQYWRTSHSKLSFIRAENPLQQLLRAFMMPFWQSAVYNSPDAPADAHQIYPMFECLVEIFCSTINRNIPTLRLLQISPNTFLFDKLLPGCGRFDKDLQSYR
jgi:hypothetical protein